MRWYLIVVLTFFSLMIDDVGLIFMYLMAICMSSSVYPDPLPIFLIGLFEFLLLSCMNSLYILNISPLSRYMICKYFLPFNRSPFHFVYGFLRCAEAFYFDVVPLVYSCFCCFCFWYQIQKLSLKSNSRSLLSAFSFMVSWFHVLLSSLYTFWVNFCVWCKTTV